MKVVKFIFTAAALLWLLVTILTVLPIAILLLPVSFISKKNYTEWIFFSTALLSSLGFYPIYTLYTLLDWNDYLRFSKNLRLHLNIMGNRIIRTVTNDTLVSPAPVHQFDTVKEVANNDLRKNDSHPTLSIFGKRVTNLPDLIDFNPFKKPIPTD
ncbi:hypothetical protein ACHRV5_18880 [Flavobacterium sp. FlaQc-52]|jgi:hypothetical protein|uniref:hypothetical protein n=1 Tax=Flavobacterium sp. FlaQc-52 TaxID=3374185 RepID=UPI0037571FE6